MGMWRGSKKRLLGIGGAAAVLVTAATLIPSAASSAPGPAARFTGIVGPGYASTTCVARTGSGVTTVPVRVAVRGGGTGITGGATRIRVTFAGTVLPTVILNNANAWEHTYPAGTPVPCTRARSNVRFQPLKQNGSPTGRADTDTLNLTLCASPCIS